MPHSPAKRVLELREQIRAHDFRYYVEARPTISDRDYDRLMQELIELEGQHPELLTPDSPSQRVGGDVQTELKSVRHAVPMMSIDNTYSEKEVRAWAERCYRKLDPIISAFEKELGLVQAQTGQASGTERRQLEEAAKNIRAEIEKAVEDGRKQGFPIGYVVEPKIDGTSINLRYENGQLVLGATRGRGNVGEDVTVNARTIKAIPLRLRVEGASAPPPAILEVRGEVYMDNEDFQRVNREIEAEGEEPYANPRNLTSGTLRRLDPKIVAKRRLKFLAHGLGEVEPLRTTSYWKWTQLLRGWGVLLPSEVSLVKNIDEVIQRLHEFEKIRPKLPYMTDGMVVKVDSFEGRERLGETSKAPRWVIAYKYESEQQPTVLREVRWQVGKGGNLTPVGVLEPVFIGGVTVTNVTLHNIDQIERLDLHFGDTVVVERAGEVIPYVADVLREKRPHDAKKIEPPRQCPSCREPVERQEGSPQIRCVNPHCPGQLRERLIWFAGRTQMDIDGLGEKIIDQLLEKRLVSTFAGLFRLKVEQISGLTHETTFGKKKATEIVKAIDAARERWSLIKDTAEEGSQAAPNLKSHLRWLAAPTRLGLKGLGEKTIDQLVDTEMVKSAEDLFRLSVDQFASLRQQVKIGDTTARKIIERSKDAKSRGLGRVLASLGIRLVGATAARSFSEWAQNIDKLRAASVEELAAVLAKDPEKKKASADKERQLAEALYQSLKDSQQRELFDTSDDRFMQTAEHSTEAVLKGRDEQLPRIERLGKSRIQKISECFPTPAELQTANPGELVECLFEGVAVARSLYDYLHSTQGEDVIESLREEGVKLTEDTIERVERADSQWLGKTVVITGSFEGYTRERIKERLISLGAKVSDSVSSKTDVVFVGTDPGSKYEKAVSLGLPIEGMDAVRQIMES